jgi:hypothetical protein
MEKIRKTGLSIKLAMIAGFLDLMAKAGGKLKYIPREGDGIHSDKSFWIIYFISGFFIILKLKTYQKWTLNSYYFFCAFNVYDFWMTSLLNLPFEIVIGSIIGYNFLSIFAVVTLYLNRKLFV